ncbi:MAG: glutamine synthetase III [Chitinophagales bacterium]|nr:glutamine synthetase III [Chitinophagales bacterium]
MRFNSLDAVMNREKVEVNLPKQRISEYFGTNVFNDDAMRKYLSEEAYLSVKASIETSQKIDRAIADQVAASLQAWALDKGATHYTHWFQPLTGATAEKHDSFFSLDGARGIESFSGGALVQQEPDASSFPNGGIRSTFEARGYTAWDPSSPAFIMEIGSGKTLCIPTIFISYTGEALDFKAPLLKSLAYLENAAVAVCKYFDKNVTKVTPTLGWEQEYFLVDEAMFYARPDLVLTGRTLLGSAPAKGQQLEDHYFGSIPDRIYGFMVDFETESLKLGIPVKTRHNEVAPGQYECAPTFEDVNLAVDHNQLLMDLMDRVAKRHKLRVLFHEKPFAGVNGSGKHNNWSMATNTGKNLLSPGKTPKTNIQFLTFFINTIKAVHRHADLLRASIASAANDHRLGANEAPPAIISVFIGKALTNVLDEIEHRINPDSFDEMDKADLKLDIHKIIPDVLLDNTDRNRTSPFAFTGNKFEIRAVGSSANCASPMTVMNAIVGQQLLEFKTTVDELIKGGEKKESAILKVLRGYISESRDILFEGDNYSDEWAREAKKRGLSNVKTTPQALDFYVSEEATKLFIESKIFSGTELEARHEIYVHNYTLKLQIEAKVLTDLALNHVLPAAISYQNMLVDNVRGLKEIGMKESAYKAQKDLLAKISENINGIGDEIAAIEKEMAKADDHKDARKQAIAYCDKVKTHMANIRKYADELETLVDDDTWPLPKYREMLFMR